MYLVVEFETVGDADWLAVISAVRRLHGDGYAGDLVREVRVDGLV